MWRVMICLLAGLYGCSGLEQSEQENIRKVNAKAEVILRQADEQFCRIEEPKRQVRELYSWEKEWEARSSVRE